MQEKEEE